MLPRMMLRHKTRLCYSKQNLHPEMMISISSRHQPAAFLLPRRGISMVCGWGQYCVLRHPTMATLSSCLAPWRPSWLHAQEEWDWHIPGHPQLSSVFVSLSQSAWDQAPGWFFLESSFMLSLPYFRLSAFSFKQVTGLGYLILSPETTY